MSTEMSHWDAGAYALGALDPADVEAFEAHLLGCDACADEVAALLPVVGLMGRVDADEMVATHNVMPRPRTVRPAAEVPPVEPPRTPPSRAAPQRPAPSRAAPAPTSPTRPVSGRVELPPLVRPEPVRPAALPRPVPVPPLRPTAAPPPLSTETPAPSRAAARSTTWPTATPRSPASTASPPRASATSSLTDAPSSAPPSLAAVPSSSPFSPAAAPSARTAGPPTRTTAPAARTATPSARTAGPSARTAGRGPAAAPGRRRRAMDTVSALHRRVRQAPRHMHLTRGSGRNRLTAAAAVILVVVAGLAFVVGTQVSGSTPEAGAVASTPVPFTGGTTQLEATDPATGVHAVLNVSVVPWGSQVQLSLGGVRGPLRCDLVAIGLDSTSTLVASWTVYAPGYGIPEEPELLTIQASTAARLADTSHFEIRQITTGGRPKTLLTLPV